MFEHKNEIHYSEIKTKYGSIGIKNILFNPTEIEKQLPILLFEDDNLCHMFLEEKLTYSKRCNIYKRFIPREKPGETLSNYITKCMTENHNFYSFLAEGVLSLVFRDIYNYKLAKGVIDVTDTLTDTHTGVDSCMYSLKDNIIILGEAKFYSDISDGINSIIADFKTKNIKNKLQSLQIVAENNDESNSIIIKNLKDNNYDGLSLTEFLQQKIVFAGFVLHSEKNSKLNYDKQFYDKFNVSVELLVKNINRSIGGNVSKDNLEIVFIHLPVNDKKELIEKVIVKAKSDFLEAKS